MMRQEASYTVEIALLLPVVLFVLFAPVYLGYEMYKTAEETFVCSWEEEFCAEDKVRNIKIAQDAWEDWRD